MVVLPYRDGTVEIPFSLPDGVTPSQVTVVCWPLRPVDMEDTEIEIKMEVQEAAYGAYFCRVTASEKSLETIADVDPENRTAVGNNQILAYLMVITQPTFYSIELDVSPEEKALYSLASDIWAEASLEMAGDWELHLIADMGRLGLPRDQTTGQPLDCSIESITPDILLVRLSAAPDAKNPVSYHVFVVQSAYPNL